MAIELLVPVFRVVEVARSMQWYRETLAMTGDPFPSTPPYEFAILRQGKAELMLRCDAAGGRRDRLPYDWDLYPRRTGERFRKEYADFRARGIVTRRLEQMPYGCAEFEMTDPDGYVICLSQRVEDANELPSPKDA